MKLFTIALTALLSLAPAQVASARPLALPAVQAQRSGTSISPSKKQASARIQVGETVSFSLGLASTCTAATSRDVMIATAAIDNGIFQGGFSVTGVAPGFVVVDYSFTDRNGNKIDGKCFVFVRAAD